MTVQEFTSAFHTVRAEFNLYYNEKELRGPLSAYADSEILCVRDYYIKTQVEEELDNTDKKYYWPLRHALVLDIEICDKKE